MAGPGGARPGAGAKKGQHRVHVKELKDAIEKHLGMPFQEIQALVFGKLFNDFQNNENTKEFIIFNENMGKRILADQIQEVNVTSELEEMSSEDIQGRINNLLARQALATTAKDDGNKETPTV